MAVKGIQRVKSRFKAVVSEIDGPRTEKALHMILSEGAALAKTMTPMDTGNLLNSQTRPEIRHSSGKSVGIISYTARYAAAVHNAPGKLKGQPRADFGHTRAGVAFGGGTGKGNYWDPRAEPGFLTKGFEQIKPAIPAILKAAYGNK